MYLNWFAIICLTSSLGGNRVLPTAISKPLFFVLSGSIWLVFVSTLYVLDHVSSSP